MIPILLALAAAQAPIGPPDATAEARYRSCVEQVRSAPAAAVETANAWRVQGGGVDARQCLGLAYAALGRWAPAATVFEQAAADAAATSDPRRADLLVQAGNAWIAGGEATRAVQAFDSALAVPQLTDELRGEVHLDRARALVSLGNAAGARHDLDRALQLVAADPMAWYLSAALARRENNLARAQTDIARAMQLAPGNPDVTLLAGTIAGLAGNMAEAQRLYRQVAQSAPDSEAGRAAQASLDAAGAGTAATVPPPAATPQPPAQPPAAPQPQSR